jgi:shikimate dehydrogenase
MSTFDDIQALVGNPLPAAARTAGLLAGSLGESPSKYSRSPGMWNAAFRETGLDACYVPFDVPPERLAALVSALRAYPGFMGGNVTVPHKLAVMPLLDEVDPTAARIGAVNTFERTADGRLVGYNSDADGLIASITRPLPGEASPFLPTLEGAHALLLGAGGAGRAGAFALAANLGAGRLTLTNRSLEKAQELVADVRAVFSRVEAVSQADALGLLADVDVVVNASTVGQSGVRHLGGGQATSLEPYSSLAPADPPALAWTDDEPAWRRAWWAAAQASIGVNNAAAGAALAACPAHTAFVDAVYSPAETTLLRQARLAGHPALNGRGMLIMQAAFSFTRRMTRRHLEAAGKDPDALFDRIVAVMSAAY